MQQGIGNVAFGESGMNKTSVHKWYKCFQDGHEDYKHCGRPSTSIDNVDK